MKIERFGVERWMDIYENQCEYNLAETCVESLTVEQLLTIAGKKDQFLSDLLPMKLTYGAIIGSESLRTSIAKLFTNQNKDNVLITHGAISANSLVYETLVEPGDHVIAVLPTYQQHQSIPKSYGAKVDLLRLHEKNGFLPDLNELKQLITPKTKLIAINNPNNPSGSLMDEAFLRELVEIAKSCHAYVLCDEVYRGLDQVGNGFTASIVDLYEKGISTGSMSKAYSLAGLRLGWMVSNLPEFLEEVVTHRDYNTISVGMIDDYLAAMALSNVDKILERSRSITRANLAVLDEWVAKEPLISFTKPKSGTTALLKLEFDMLSWDFCVKLLEATGVMLCPGSVMEMEGYVRIGYANNIDVLKQGLAKMSEFLKTLNKTNA
ncbi:aminotransferase [Zophobihabitans entericus]|uniref:Aminotransferase n=1 Tax=Zophobihabitans entericus TaxID=1635327 RepID=A0A6G9I9J8_9GAMM|nr:aminotransferase [Zophobihabitans entericus]QIQ20404.1 aminotransferase [Zophobihabitans entericus]